MEFWQWVLFSFNGRITRKYYWYAAIILFVVFGAISGLLFGTNSKTLATGDFSFMLFVSMALFAIVYIFGIWIGLAVAVKRWHDRGKSGWWVLIGLIPIVGGIWILVECGFLPGTPGPNAYGVENQLPTDPFQGVDTPQAPLQ